MSEPRAGEPAASPGAGDPAAPETPLATRLVVGSGPTAAPEPAPARAPVAAADRLAGPDVLRALALLAVAAVNAVVFAAPMEEAFVLPLEESRDPLALGALRLAVAGKGYSILAFLLGAGLALQADRLERAGAGLGPLVRRLLALGAIGLAHGLLLWSGDVLLPYAVTGLLWLLFRRVRARGLVLWSGGLLAATLLVLGGAGGALALAAQRDPGSIAELQGSIEAAARGAAATARLAYGAGDLSSALSLRASQLGETYGSALVLLPQFLALVLAGTLAARAGLLTRPGEHRPALRAAAALGLAAGAAGEWVALWLGAPGVADFPRYLAGQGVHFVAAPALALGGAAAVLLLLEAGRARALSLLAPLGRVSLSAYLLQSVVLGLLLQTPALGLYGRLGPAAAIGLGAAVWLGEAALARAWLARHREGPAERLVQRIAYGASARG